MRNISTAKTKGAGCESIQWKGREGTRLNNGTIELIALTVGGHVSALRFLDGTGHPSDNVLWEAPWPTRDPSEHPDEEMQRIYGPAETGRFIAGYTGHALCLDCFGPPSVAEAAAGLGLHGEAAVTRWNVVAPADSVVTSCQWNLRLPIARLIFEREIRLGDGESVAYVQETITSEREEVHAFDWVQHVTLGKPLLGGADSTLAVSAKRGITWPFVADDGKQLTADQEFSWPYAPRADAGFVDLSKPLGTEGWGSIVALQLDPLRQTEFILAVNWELRLGVGYCFRRDDFPWLTIWEENRARQDAPWNGETQACGLEFGTTPLPLGRQETMRRGQVFDSPSWCVLPARGRKTARYLIFLVNLPLGIQDIQDVAVHADAIILYDRQGDPVLSIPAKGCEDFLSLGYR